MSDNTKIEKNVPMPKRGRQNGVSKYPFAQMDVGDSFALSKTMVLALRSATYLAAKKLNFKFSVFVRGDECRVWRIK